MTGSLLVIILLKLSILDILLGLDISLPLLQGLLGLALEALVGGESILLAGAGILTDLLVNSLVKFLQTISLNILGKVRRELLLVLGVIFLLEVLHVLTNVSSEDALTVHVRVVLLGVTVITRESLLGMGDVKSTIGSTLQGTEDTASSGGGLAPNIEKGTEGTLVLVDLINVVGSLSNRGRDYISIDLVITLINIIQTNLLEETTSAQQSSAVGGGVVLKTNLQSVTGQFVRAGRRKNAVTIDQGVHNLADHLTVGETHDDTVLGGLVLVLGLAA
mmetsp:Transcript_9612/g.14526  ORF Transcript_9612/g.14526 Transcript_9612/m.14526 type:complete len:276 (-) Transcript_9612:118-945(-)